MDGSDPEFNTVLVRSPNVFGIFRMQIPRFLTEIYDFEQFSWAPPVQDFSKNTLLLERYLCTSTRVDAEEVRPHAPAPEQSYLLGHRGVQGLPALVRRKSSQENREAYN